MKKGFIFDMDGVMIDSESVWDVHKKIIYQELFGDNIASKLGSTVGINMFDIYKMAKGYGATVLEDEFIKSIFQHAPVVYKTANLTQGLPQLIDTLTKFNYQIGIVSTSPKEWVKIVIKRLSFEDKIGFILSLHKRKDLRHKPFPDGYLTAMKELQVTPQATVVLEDSNSGISSAKAAGAYTIGFTQNLVNGIIPKGADVYAGNMEDVITIIRQFDINEVPINSHDR